MGDFEKACMAYKMLGYVQGFIKSTRTIYPEDYRKAKKHFDRLEEQFVEYEKELEEAGK